LIGQFLVPGLEKTAPPETDPAQRPLPSRLIACQFLGKYE